MSSRNIAVRKDVYDALRKEQRPGESFTRVLLRLLHQRGPPEELLGSWGEKGPRSEPHQWAALRGAGGSKRAP